MTYQNDFNRQTNTHGKPWPSANLAHLPENEIVKLVVQQVLSQSANNDESNDENTDV